MAVYFLPVRKSRVTGVATAACDKVEFLIITCLTRPMKNASFANISLHSALNLKALFHNTRGHVLDPIQFFSLFSPLKHPALSDMVGYDLLIFEVTDLNISDNHLYTSKLFTFASFVYIC